MVFLWCFCFVLSFSDNRIPHESRCFGQLFRSEKIFCSIFSDSVHIFWVYFLQEHTTSDSKFFITWNGLGYILITNNPNFYCLNITKVDFLIPVNVLLWLVGRKKKALFCIVVQNPSCQRSCHLQLYHLKPQPLVTSVRKWRLEKSAWLFTASD